jgi:LysB family phage lysis regulatory protein
MSTRLLLALVAAVALAAFVQFQQLQAAKARAALAIEQRDTARTELATVRTDLEQLRERETEKERQRAALAATQQQLERTLADRTATIRRLQRENDELRQWADQPLPEPVARLRERPALTGATAYQQYLRNTGALPAVSERPPD